MTKQKALLMMLLIVDECKNRDSCEEGCRECLFGTKSGHCLVTGGNDIPTNWAINKVVYEVMDGEGKE